MNNFNLRRTFGRDAHLIDTSNLISVQIESFVSFLQKNVVANKRLDQGLQNVLKETLMLNDPNSRNTVEFIEYEVKDPEYTEEECISQGRTYSSDIKVKLRLVRYLGKGDEKVAFEIKEQSLFLCSMPLMCKDGGFIINGVHRIIVSQLHKSSGVFFNVDDFKGQGLKKIYSANIIPHRGTWVDFEIDYKGLAWAKIDKRKKISLTTFLMLFGLKNSENGTSRREILDMFYTSSVYRKSKFGRSVDYDELWLTCFRSAYDILNPKTGEVILQAGKSIITKKLKEIEELKSYAISEHSLIGMFLAQEVKIEDTIYEVGSEITEGLLEHLKDLDEIKVLNIDNNNVTSVIRDTLFVDKNTCIEEALLTFHKVIRPGETATLEGARYLFASMFFDAERYDFSMVGRVKLNYRLRNYYKTNESNQSNESKLLTFEDIFCITKCLIALREGKENPDNIDHLYCRRVRSVGELVANQCRAALYKISKSLKDRLNVIDGEESIDLSSIFQSKVLISSLREFFGTSQLSQIMDNLNSLSRLAHCRRITAMGKGGVVASRAGDSMRDVGESYYGRICPVETPEGQNIGLISYLSMYAKVDEYGFIQSPYRKVIDGVIQNDIVYLDAQEEEGFNIAPFSVQVDKNGKILNDSIPCRRNEEYIRVSPKDINYIDVASGQILSVASSLIPFIAKNDPGRALMGSNMQRQALPLKRAQAPIIGTGMEYKIGVDSMMCVISNYDGNVIFVDNTKIFVQRIDDFTKIDTYILKKFQRSNSYSCINQTPIVKVGDIVKAGQVIADGSSIDNGEVSLGVNLRVAFLPFKGNTFEDSIVLSEKLLNDKLTSVKIDEIVVAVKDGETIVRAIPGVSEEFLKNLDEVGIVTLGAKVKEGDILVGRVIPKLETVSTPEERLLKAMFGEKSANYVDAGLRVPPGCEGTVIDVKIFSKKISDKDERELLIERLELNNLKKNRDLEISTILKKYHQDILLLLEDQIIKNDFDNLKSGTKLTKELLSDLNFDDYKNITVEDELVQSKISLIYSEAKIIKKEINSRFDGLAKKLVAPVDLPSGVMKQIKIFIATNRVIEAGDKMAGRHGNKGIISKIMPVEDMPFDKDGKPVDIILNPLGVAARMNIGQIFEVALGWVSKEIGSQVSSLLGAIYNSHKNYQDLKKMLKKVYPTRANEIEKMSNDQLLYIALNIKDGLPFAVPSFDEDNLEALNKLQEEWGLPKTGQILLRDGVTGKYYPNPITVGYMYMLKLNHMVSDKIHARSTGSYSLITQQPPGGRAKMGGQRTGEMEIWALQAYGAAYLTKETMTIKSDDHIGRVAAYDSIVKGQEIIGTTNTPESFKVLMQELRAVMLNPECLLKRIGEDNQLHFDPATMDTNFDALRIGLMSPEQVRSYSYGEVKKAETLNYRTQKAEIGGLHCPVIFGPEKNYRCACGRYCKMKYRGIVCEKCHVEVTVSRVRRERMGHIELNAPVAHVWFTKILPSSIGLMLDLSTKDLDKILRYESYIVVDSGITPLEDKQMMSEKEYEAAQLQYGSTSFVADMGAEAIESLLKQIDLEKEKARVLETLSGNLNDLLRKKFIRKLRMINGFIFNSTRPEWMIIRALPILPADLRPLVPLDGGRVATPDSNDLYRRVVNRNNRLSKLDGFPEIVKRNEKRMLSAAVNAVIDNSRGDKPFVSSNGRKLQSIGDLLKGKQGRFRQNLLGKRVDFSGRSVIVVGPNLKLHQCGLPKKMALELFKPFIYARLEQYGYAMTLRSAKRIVDERRPEVWEILKEVVYQHPILLNRPPTLHRLGIQAFECVLIDSNAIQLHPLVCSAFNADFDGDQMSVHVPLSVAAQLEARILMMPSNNLLSPANGAPTVAPKKDMILGLYYLTYMVEGLGNSSILLNQSEVEKAVESGAVYFNQEITAIIDCPVRGVVKVATTPGRVLLFNNLPKNHKIPFMDVNKLFIGGHSAKLFQNVYKSCSRSDVVVFADVLMQLGFKYATKSCASLGIGDLINLDCKEKVVGETRKKIDEYDRQFKEGLITKGEKRNKVAEAWLKCENYLGKEMEKELAKVEPGKTPNPLYMMYYSGARGSTGQMRQLLSMRGLVIKPNGEWVEDAITKNYKEGFDALSYFIATHGTRKGFTDMALKTADAGYFTRKLVEVAQDCIIKEYSCDNGDTEENIANKFIVFEPNNKNGLFDYSGAEGRVLAEDVIDPETNEVLFKRYHLLTSNDLEVLSNLFILNIKIRSPITCSREFGICSICYGLDLSKATMVSTGEAVGIIAAQSIGEPGAQLTMRTFHSGGGSVGSTGESSVIALSDGYIKFNNLKTYVKSDNSKVVLSRYAEAIVYDECDRQRSSHKIPYGSKLFFKDGDKIAKGKIICEWDPHLIPRLSTANGYVHYQDLVEGISFKKIIDEYSGLSSVIVIDYKKLSRKKSSLNPCLVIKDKDGNDILTEDGLPIIYKVDTDDVIMFDDKAPIEIGDMIIKKQRLSAQSSDITSGLPKLIEVFEARNPKLQAIMSEIGGVVSINKDNRIRRTISITSLDGLDSREYSVSKDINLLVQTGDIIKQGELITEGDVSLHDILRILGMKDLVSHLLKSIKEIFTSHAMIVDNKHVECIIRYMLRKVEVVDARKSEYVNEDVLELSAYNKLVEQYGKDSENVPTVRLILQGITRAASTDSSFLKAASFQEPHKALINACLSTNSIDLMLGMKESLITGHVMPAGTGSVVSQWEEEYFKSNKKIN